MGMTYKPTWKTFFELGKEELRKEKYKLAIISFQKSIRYTRTENNITLNLIYCAISYYYLGDITESIYWSIYLFERRERFALKRLWELINNLRWKDDIKTLKDLNKFLKILENIINKNKSNILIKEPKETLKEIFYMRAYILKSLGQLRWSLFYFSKIIPSVIDLSEMKQREKNYFTWVLSSRAGVYIDKNNYNDAVRDINNALIMQRWNYRAYMKASLIYKKFKNYSLSISMLSQAIDLRYHFLPSKEELVYCYINRGYLRIKNGNIEEGMNDFELAYFEDNFCMKKYKEITKKIPKGVKTIMRINTQIKI